MFQDFPDDSKNDDFLNEFRQKIADQSAASFEEKRNEMKRSKSVFIGAISGVALAGIVGWFVLSPRYAANNPEEIPVIRRPQTAVKIQPSEPGGMEILNQDKSVYDIVERKPEDETKVENLLPPPEQPKLPVIEASAPTPASSQATGNKIPDEMFDDAPREVATAPIAVQEDQKVIAEAQKIIAAKNQAEDKVVTIKEASMQQPSVGVPEKVDTIKVVNDVKQNAAQKNWAIKDETIVAANTSAATITAPVAAIANGSIPAGSWQVQLMSSQNKKAIENAWNSLSKKYAVLKGQPHEIETADLDFDGIFYRLKAGAFADKAGADSLCRDIKALGGTCIVKKK